MKRILSASKSEKGKGNDERSLKQKWGRDNGGDEEMLN